MNRLFLEKLLEHKHLFEPLLEIDNRVMNSTYYSSQIEAYIEVLLSKDDSNLISIQPNSLILATGEIFEILSFLARVSPENNFILFPNCAFMGMNHLFVKLFNFIYGNRCYLSKERNYNCYFNTKDAFEAIYILGSKTVYLEMQSDFPEAKWIRS